MSSCFFTVLIASAGVASVLIVCHFLKVCSGNGLPLDCKKRWDIIGYSMAGTGEYHA